MKFTLIEGFPYVTALFFEEAVCNFRFKQKAKQTFVDQSDVFLK